MNFLTQLKLSPVASLADARFAAAAGFSYLGFCFDPKHPDFILPIRAKEIIEWISGSHFVGEFGDQSAEEIQQISELMQVDIILVNNGLFPDELKEFSKPVIKAIEPHLFSEEEMLRILEAYQPVVDAFQLNGLPLRIAFLKELMSHFKIILDPKTDHTNLKTLVNEIRPHALNLSPGKEEKTGIQEFDELNDIIESLRV